MRLPRLIHSSRVVFLLLISLATTGSLHAQTATATLFVDAHDQSGGVVPAVEVTLVNDATGAFRTVTTGAQGTAVVPVLPAGAYTATATKLGFKKDVVTGLQLDAGTKGTLHVLLVPGAVSESVTVTADASRIRASTGTIDESFNGRTLVMMPVEQRDFLQFSWQSPGVTPPAPGSRLSSEGNNSGVNVSGAREAANNFLLDGADNNDRFLNRLVVTPSLEAIQEFTLTQNTYDAEYGRNAGGQVNVVLKSGSSRTAGSLFEYYRHDGLDARGVFDLADEPKPLLRRHQFGGTLGGPIARLPSAFYFASLEGSRTRDGETRAADVPTAAMRAGDFSATGITLRDPLSGAPFPGNRIPQSRLDSAGLRVAALYPEPNRSTPGENLVTSPVGTRNGVRLTVKTDFQAWTHTPVFVHYTLTGDDRVLPFPEHDRNVPGFPVTNTDVGQNLAVGVTRALSPRVFNELRVGWNRLRRDNHPVAAPGNGFTALGIRGPALVPQDLGYPGFALAGYQSLGDDTNLPLSRRTHTLHLSDSVSIDRGRQQLKLGVELRHYRSGGYNHLFSRGQISFTGAYTGDALGDLLLGLPSFSLVASNDNRQALRTTAVDAFVQHDWRPSPSLTLSAGLRYEVNAPPVDEADRMRVFDLTSLSLVQVGRDGVPRSGTNTDWNNLAPRLGVAWHLPGTTGTMLRAGWGLYYDSGTLIENSALYFNPPYFDLQVYFPQAQPITLADPFPAGQAYRPAPSVNTLRRDFPAAVTEQGSVGFEGRIAGLDWTARYVGAHGSHLVRRRNINQPTPGPGPDAARRPYPEYADILLVEPAGRSDYHALQVKVDRQRPDGLSVRAAYTWSKAIDDSSGFLMSEGTDNTAQDARHPALERGLSDFDARHRVSVAGVWMLPAGSRAWLRDWTITAILAAQSGRPFTPRVGFDNSNTGNVGGSFGYDRPNEVDPASAPANAVFYDGRAFVIAPPYTFGNAGRNTLIGPGYATLDLAAGKGIACGGTRRLEARVEVYNALNRENLDLPDTFVDRATFGKSLSALPPREAQLVLRFAF